MRLFAKAVRFIVESVGVVFCMLDDLYCGATREHFVSRKVKDIRSSRWKVGVMVCFTDCFISASVFLRETYTNELELLPENRLGFPTNDQLFVGELVTLYDYFSQVSESIIL